MFSYTPYSCGKIEHDDSVGIDYWSINYYNNNLHGYT